MSMKEFVSQPRGRRLFSSPDPNGGGAAVADAPAAPVSENKIDIEAFKKTPEFLETGILAIAQQMARPDITDEDRYRLSKLMIETTKVKFIDPMKDLRDKEKEDEQKKADERAKILSVFRDKISGIISADVLEEIADIAEDYIKAGHGKVISIEIYAQQDPETGEIKAQFNSNVAKPKSGKSATTRTREGGATGAGVTVQGKTTKEGKTGPEYTEPQKFGSFAEAARTMGFVNETTEMKGLNCKRLIESMGYTCAYLQAAPPATDGTAAADAATPAA